MENDITENSVASHCYAVSFTDEHVQFIQRFGGKCRDCADESGVCPNTGFPCGAKRQAIESVLRALEYGFEYGHIGLPMGFSVIFRVGLFHDDEFIESKAAFDSAGDAIAFGRSSGASRFRVVRIAMSESIVVDEKSA